MDGIRYPPPQVWNLDGQDRLVSSQDTPLPLEVEGAGRSSGQLPTDQ